MRPEDLRPGYLYRLTGDVINPGKIDQRSSDPFRNAKEFKKGTNFLCMSEEDAPSLIYICRSRSTRSYNLCMGAHRVDGFSQETLRDNSRLIANAIAPMLENVPLETRAEINLVFDGYTFSRALLELWEDGTISLERLLSLLRKNDYCSQKPKNAP